MRPPFRYREELQTYGACNADPGETVLDLGSGGGIDVSLLARRVAPTGKAYGLDMTDDMLALARENQRKAGLETSNSSKGNRPYLAARITG